MYVCYNIYIIANVHMFTPLYLNHKPLQCPRLPVSLNYKGPYYSLPGLQFNVVNSGHSNPAYPGSFLYCTLVSVPTITTRWHSSTTTNCGISVPLHKLEFSNAERDSHELHIKVMALRFQSMLTIHQGLEDTFG